MMDVRGTVTLRYSAHDICHDGALVLRDYLLERTAKRRPPWGRKNIDP